MFCSKCGAENPDTSNFCKECGAPLNPAGQGEGLPAEPATGLEPNVAGALCYVLGWLTGLVFLLIEKQDQFVRFHAIQSIVVFGAISVVQIILGILAFVTFFFTVIGWLVWIASVILWVFLIYRAYRGERYKLPWAGNFAENHI